MSVLKCKSTFLGIILILAACAPVNAVLTPQVVSVYATPAAQPWLKKLVDCANQQSVVVRLSDSPSDVDIMLRLGEPVNLSTPAFQVDKDDLLVIANRAKAINSLSIQQVRGLFTGQVSDWSQIDPSKAGKVQVWVFAEGSDMQEAFAKTLTGGPFLSSARLATSPEEMSRAIAADENAVGILSRQWETDGVMDVYVVASLPVLAITLSEPHGMIKNLLSCIQK
jgi:hypothetical protein